MERDEDLGVRVRVERIEVDDERRDDERRSRHHPPAKVERPPAGEVRRQERQHEQAEVAREPRRLVVGEAREEARDLDHDGRANGEHEGLDPAARGRRGFLPRAEQLLPQPVAVLAGELPGDGVHVAQPFHRDQERLVLLEPGCAQLGHLVPEVVLELVDVVAVERRGPGDVHPPLGDLRFHVLHAHASPRVVRRAPDPGHASFRARVTASHCRRCSASAARPSSVIT